MPQVQEKSPKPGTTNAHGGHRARLRHRLLNGGAEALADYEVLEYLLFAANPRGDTKPLAKALMERFGNLNAVLNAETGALTQVAGMGETGAAADRDGDRRAPERHHPRMGHHAAALHHARADDRPDHRQGVRKKPCAGRVAAACCRRRLAFGIRAARPECPSSFECHENWRFTLLNMHSRARALCVCMHARMSCARPCVLRMCPCMDACMHA